MNLILRNYLSSYGRHLSLVIGKGFSNFIFFNIVMFISAYLLKTLVAISIQNLTTLLRVAFLACKIYITSQINIFAKKLAITKCNICRRMRMHEKSAIFP
jgi:hypothetical protein